MRQKKKVGIFSRGRANIALFDTVELLCKRRD